MIWAVIAKGLLDHAEVTVDAETVVVPRTRIRIEEGKGRRLVILPANSTLRQLVNRLNALGLGPRDLIHALQAIKSSGALQAEIVVR